MASGSEITFAPEMMDEAYKNAMLEAATLLLTNDKSIKRVWPGAYDTFVRHGSPLVLKDVEMVVLPLDRIGAPAGNSGAKIFITYFNHRSASSNILASPPLAMKLGNPGELASEFNFLENWPTLTEEISARLALPIISFEITKELGVLCSPFRSTFHPDTTGKRHGISLTDLWHRLREKITPAGDCDPNKVEPLLTAAFKVMAEIHRAHQGSYTRETVSYYDQYGWYLRNTHLANESGTKNAPLIEALLGTGDQIERFGETWPHPTAVLRKIIDSKMTAEMALGPVHGDLHPKNIVVDHMGSVQIIDFGWATDRGHLMVDYLLLDLNLRAVTLPALIPEAACLEIAGMLNRHSSAPLADCVEGRARLIRETIWKRLEEDSGLLQDWRAEYLLPLFIIGYGLLVHVHAAENQAALLATVLAAGREIESTWPK